jgi:mono/diheme cytochrome c family protein
MLLLGGCAAQEAKFAERADLKELIPEAAQHVRTVVEEHFGTPTDVVAWERLPIQYHAATGSFVATAGGSEPLTQLPVQLDSQSRAIAAGQELLWLTGKYVGQPSPLIVAFQSEGSLVTLDPPIAEPPDAGDRFIAGPGAVLTQGRMLYAEHCQHCHGVSGDGAGPTAKYLNPRPRDYRLGKFKFTSTHSSERATREDLARILEEGIPGTYMPSFKLLTPEESQALVEYVLWLSMRGEVEYKLVQALKGDYSTSSVEAALSSARGQDAGVSASNARQEVLDELTQYLTEDWPDEFSDDTRFLASQWTNAHQLTAQVLPKEPLGDVTAESRQRGRLLYLSAKAKCATCHGPWGLGDGSQTRALQKNPMTNEDYPEPGLYDDWGNPLKPRNLASGIFRGGRRPVDLYRRIYAGIKGTPMPAFGTVLSDREIWDLVNYVMHIPFEAREQHPGDGQGQPTAEPPQVAAHDTPR